MQCIVHHWLGWICALALVIAGSFFMAQVAAAQNDAAENATTAAEIEGSATTSATDEDAISDEPPMPEIGIADESPTLAELLDEAQTVTEEDLADEPVIGEVVGVTDDGVVLVETIDGDIVALEGPIRQRARTGGAGRLLNPRVGDAAIVPGSADSVLEATLETRADGALVAVADDQAYTIADESMTARNGDAAPAQSFTNGEAVLLVIDARGSVRAVHAQATGTDASGASGPDGTMDTQIVDGATATDTEENEENPFWLWILGGIAALLVLGFLLLK